MASAIGSRSRIFILVWLVTFSMFWFDAVRAQEAAPLPDYVIEKFGKPPAVPKGPLSKKLQSAVQVVFVDGMDQSAWGKDQALALDEISKSKDPRIVWLISDLMRFVSQRELHEALARPASSC